MDDTRQDVTSLQGGAIFGKNPLTLNSEVEVGGSRLIIPLW